jgi:hypothetical protein
VDHVDRRSVLKTTGLSLAGVASLAGCAGQGSNNSGSGGTTTSADDSNTNTDSSEWPDHSGKELHFVTDESNPSAQKFLKEVGSSFESATGASVKMEFVGRGSSGSERVIQLLQAGDPPEIFTANQAQAISWAIKGILTPVNKPLQAGADRLGELPGENARTILEGDDYSVPFGANAGCYWYRSDVIGDVVPDTWDKTLEFAEMANGKDGLTGTYVPAGSGSATTYHFLDWLYSNEGTMATRENGEVQIAVSDSNNRDRWVETMEFIKELYQYSPDATDSSWSTMIQAIPNGTAASNWYGGARPKVQSVEAGKDFAKDLHPVQMPKKRARVGDGSADGFVTFEGANTETAKTFLNFFLQMENMVALPFELSPIHVVSPWPTVVNSDRWQERIDGLPEAWSKDDIQTYMVEVMESYQPVSHETEPPNPYAGSLIGSGHVTSFVQEVLINDKNPDSIIDTYAEKLQSSLDKAKQ